LQQGGGWLVIGLLLTIIVVLVLLVATGTISVGNGGGY
jgi:hypothetical protein